MAMIRVEPVEIGVRTDWFDGRPRELSWDGRKLPVTDIVGVRDESAAFPVVVGPRTVFEVETPSGRLTVTYRHRTRRWTLEALDGAAKAA